MPDTVHLLIPFASALDEGCRHALDTLQLPQLEKLLARLAPIHTEGGDEFTLSLPHERVLAGECGLPCQDGHIPWAAWQVEQAGREAGGEAWARITPCHWTVGADHIDMSHPQDLQLDADESQTLLAAMRPFFEQDGIALEYDAPTLWLARGELFRGLATASLDRVVGRTINEWMPRAPEARTLLRLQQEMQMLLYTHQVNEERVRGGSLPVNSFWVSGTGALPLPHAATVPPGLQITHDLRDAALRNDWHGWTAAWQQLDSGQCARLLEALDSGGFVTLTLCGERMGRSWCSHPGASLLGRVGGRFGRLFAGSKTRPLLESL